MPEEQTRTETTRPIISPNDHGMDVLCRELAKRAAELDLHPQWPVEQLKLCAAAGVPRWIAPTSEAASAGARRMCFVGIYG